MTDTTVVAPPPVTGAEARARRLVLMKRRATALLAGVTAVFLAVTLWGGDATWAGYVQATAEAAMIGGLADWFAVVALFRHPLGLPIPHTAVIVARKDQFAETLGTFIQETFLTPDAVMDRLHASQAVPRLATWLQEPANADRVATELLAGGARLAHLADEEQVGAALAGTVRARVEATPVAPLAGRALAFAIRDGRHQQALETVLREVDVFIDANRGDLRRQLGEASPWWLPGAAEDRLFERLVDGVRTLTGAMLADDDHALRRRFDQRLAQLAEDLQTSPELAARGEELKAEVLANTDVAEWVGSMWGELRRRLVDQADRPDPDLRSRLAAVVASTGARLEDPEEAARVDAALGSAVTYVVEHFQGEIVTLVRATIERWDAEETASRLELLLGPDLQFIRINGTVVGALAGLVLHAVAQLLG